MMIFCFLVKIIITTHTHTHTNQIKKNLLGQPATSLATYRDSYIQKIPSNLPCSACIFIHPHICINRSVPPTHEYGTRPFLRWARSQGQSPHASGKAKNTFGPVGIPLLGAPQAPGNKPPLGYKPGGMAPWGQRKSPVPRHTRQNRPEVRRPTECNPRTGEERPHTNALERPRGPTSKISLMRPHTIIRK